VLGTYNPNEKSFNVMGDSGAPKPPQQSSNQFNKHPSQQFHKGYMGNAMMAPQNPHSHGSNERNRYHGGGGGPNM
jgi:hypothetical protein